MVGTQSRSLQQVLEAPQAPEQVPYIMTFIERVDWSDPGPLGGIAPHPIVAAEKWTHWDESTGLLSSEGDTTTD